MPRNKGIGLGWLILTASILISATAGFADKPGPKKVLSVADLYHLDVPQDTALSPDGTRAAFARQWIDAASKQERHSLWLVDGAKDRSRPMEKDQADARRPLFSPDGKWVAFQSTRPRPRGWKPIPPAPPASDPPTDVWLISANGGNVVPLGGPDKAYGRVFNDGFYGRVAFSPDGRRLVFVADDGKDPRGPDEIAAGVEVVRPDQGEGYTGYGPAQIWVAHLDPDPGSHAALRIDRLTHDDVWYGDPHWSPDGRTVVVHANKSHDRESVRYSINKNFDLWAIDVQTRAARQLTFGPGPEVSPRFAPDGRRLACLSIPRKGSHRDLFNLAIVNLGDGSPKTRVLFDHHASAVSRPPHPAPVFPLPERCWEGSSLFYNGETGTGGGLVRLDLTTGRGQFLMPLGGNPPGPPKTFLQRAQRLRRLTPPGNLFLQERALASSKVVNWKNEGHTLEGILTVPPPEAAKPPYKLILYPHGGPHSRSILAFDFTVQVLAAHGYAVFQPNFRGSAGYGQKFIDADRNDFGGGDMRDILTGIDELINQKLVDRDRQFVYGTSYGGFMTCWLVTQTQRFRAAVAQNAVTDLTMMWGLSDLQSWTQWEFDGYPWEVSSAMRRHSPLSHVARVQTPTLILHARDDRRCPLPMGRAFYQALLARKVATQMVIYPGEGHGIRQPLHREDVLRRVLAWFERHNNSGQK
jgi:dipeptidyl aminopeptidase/acylaminoacyl peptidase